MKKLNQVLYRVMMSVNIVLIISYALVWITKMRPVNNCVIAITISIISLIVIYISYIKGREKENFKYIVLTTNSLVYFCFVFLSGINSGYMIGIVVSFIYIFYMDVRLSELLGLLVIGMTFAFLVQCYFRGEFPEGNPVNVKNTALILGAVVAFAGLLRFCTMKSKEIVRIQLENIGKDDSKAREIMDDMVKTANVISDGVENAVYNINELDGAIDNTNNIFQKISEANASNVSSVEIQTEMTMKITELIDFLVNDFNNAKKITTEFTESLGVSKQALEQVKTISKDIIEVNIGLLYSINEFVSNASDVKKITSGINDISEQTNLLSLNATIESAKAGEVGKGFAVVAEEVRNLSQNTGVLTNEIEDIVKELDSDALKAQEIIKEIEKAIEDENYTINEAMNKFQDMEDKMRDLKLGMHTIMDSTDNVVRYNNEITEHIEQLSGEAEEVTAYIEEVTAINSKNKDKVVITKKLMNELKEKMHE